MRKRRDRPYLLPDIALDYPDLTPDSSGKALTAERVRDRLDPASPVQLEGLATLSRAPELSPSGAAALLSWKIGVNSAQLARERVYPSLPTALGEHSARLVIRDVVFIYTDGPHINSIEAGRERGPFGSRARCRRWHNNV